MQKSLNLEKEMTFVSHLEELRWHLVRAGIAVAFFTIAAFFFAPWIFENIIFAPARVDFPTFQALCTLGNWIGSDDLCVGEISFRVQSRTMTGQFSMHIMASLVIGIILSFPYIIWEMWQFFKPALYEKELHYSKGAVSSISFLFLLGVFFGFYILAPIMISFLANYSISNMITNEFDITSYVSTVVGVVFSTALLFQLPVVIYFLTNMGIVTPTFLRKYRKHAVVIILILGAIITPSADPLSQILISGPLYILFEVSILISANVMKKRLKQEINERMVAKAA